MNKLVPIDSIKPDKNQPRKIFSQSHIEGLARSLEMEGMINAIEISEDMVILTGECRWRAARFLGWKEIPVNVNPSAYSEYDRLRHQMAENVHQSGTKESIVMNALDVAKAYARLFKLKTGKDYQPDRLSFKDVYGNIKVIADEIGVTTETIKEYLKLLEHPEFIQKDISKGRPRTYYDETRWTTPEFKKQIERKIASGEFKSRPKITEMVRLARRTPDLARIILSRKLSEGSLSANRILNGVARLGLALEAIKLEKVAKNEREIVKGQLEWLQQKISEYLAV